ncbi:MAG: glycosyltransferase family 2 protein, partial [Bacteroidetes bacterium]|nr:glycosyltransferase family 2 protein [Bacteroidota bacterium]
MQPLFTIVIPSYNRGHLILKAIRSVLSQTFNDFEIIVVDDGSTDDTESVVKKLSNQKLKYYKIENSERGAARNFGGKCAQGKYLTFLDSDDVLYTNHLKKAADFIEQFHPVVFHQDFEMISEEGRLLKTFTVS